MIIEILIAPKIICFRQLSWYIPIVSATMYAQVVEQLKHRNLRPVMYTQGNIIIYQLIKRHNMICFQNFLTPEAFLTNCMFVLSSTMEIKYLIIILDFFLSNSSCKFSIKGHLFTTQVDIIVHLCRYDITIASQSYSHLQFCSIVNEENFVNLMNILPL